MFPAVSLNEETPIVPPNGRLINVIQSTEETGLVTYNSIDELLELEKQSNKNENWNKLDKMVKTQKLHSFADKHGKENSFSAKDIKALKTFFSECLEKNKLQKTKDVNYDKVTKEIMGVPALHFNTTAHNFTLKIVDAKRVSTLKSLTPKRTKEADEKLNSN